MNKKIFWLLIAISMRAGQSLMAVTGELASQLSLQRGVIHYPLEKCDPKNPWQIDIWAAGYCRNACSAFICDECNWNGSTTSMADLSALFFGKSSFFGQNAFPGGVLTEPSGNPGLTFDVITPELQYNEAGVFIGLHAQKDICDTNWSMGWRGSLPISRVQVQQTNNGQLETAAASVNGVFANYVDTRQEFTNADINGSGAKMNDVTAYRLDFLNTLQFDGAPMIGFGDGTNDTTVAGVPITLYTERGGTAQDHVIAPMYVLRASNGNLANAITIGTPTGYEGSNNLAQDIGPANPADPTQVAPYILNAAGTNGSDGDRRAFSQTVDYLHNLAHDPLELQQWFLVPNPAGGADVLDVNANAVKNAIDYVLQNANLYPVTATLFFQNNNVDISSSECAVGAGDLYLEWYAGYHKPCWYLDMLIGSKIPTGKKTCDAGRVYWQSTGNNGHFEFRSGFEGGVRRSWFALRGMATYSYAFDHTEMRAPAFVGATIKNIPVGPSVPARVHWGYFWGNLDITIFPTKCDNCGFVIGYELYAKQDDKVCFCSSTAQDFLGYTHPLDDKILEQGTDTRLNKIRGEVFTRFGCCEIFGGAYYSLAGRYAMKETEFHVGTAIYF